MATKETGAKPTPKPASKKPAAKAGKAAPAKKPTAKKPSIAERIEAIGINDICSLFADGMTHTAIAAKAGVSHGNLSEWLAADPDRSARAREARTHAARVWDEKALEAIEQAEDPFQLQRARELAQHYRWRASKTAPKEYGDKITNEHTGADGGAINHSITIDYKCAEARGDDE